MKFNNNKHMSANKKSLWVRVGIVAIIIIGAIVFGIVFMPKAKEIAGQLQINEMFGLITLFITLATIVVKISEKILPQSYAAKRRISIEVQTKDEYTIITGRIENCGTKRIVPQNIYLLVEEGKEIDGEVSFPYLLKHEAGEFDCVLAKKCKEGGVACIPDDIIESKYKGLYRRMLKLKHLSSETVLFVDPGEEFSEDVALKLKKGVYRATIVWTSVKEDCICATKGFVV